MPQPEGNIPQVSPQQCPLHPFSAADCVMSVLLTVCPATKCFILCRRRAGGCCSIRAAPWELHVCISCGLHPFPNVMSLCADSPCLQCRRRVGVCCNVRAPPSSLHKRDGLVTYSLPPTQFCPFWYNSSVMCRRRVGVCCSVRAAWQPARRSGGWSAAAWAQWAPSALTMTQS